MGVNALRHSKISHFLDRPQIQTRDRENLAKEMGHSLGMVDTQDDNKKLRPELQFAVSLVRMFDFRRCGSVTRAEELDPNARTEAETFRNARVREVSDSARLFFNAGGTNNTGCP